MKRINEILKSLNFPKFYYKEKGEAGETLYVFGNENCYNQSHYIKLIENLPFTEETIHADDVDFIIQFLNNSLCWNSLDNHVNIYLMKIVDNKELGSDDPKVDNIIMNFRVKIYKAMYNQEIDIEDVITILSELPYKEDDIHKKDVKNTKDFLKKSLKLYKSGNRGMNIPKKSKELKKAIETYLLNMIDNNELFYPDKTPKTNSILKPKRFGKIVHKILDKEDEDGLMSDFDQSDRIRSLEKENRENKKMLKSLIKQVEYSIATFDNSKSEFGESKEKMKKNLKRWKKQLKK